MNREDLLTKLAMEIPSDAWGDGYNVVRRKCDDEWAFDTTWHSTPTDISLKEWLAKRERLINKPSWADAPKWAQWLAQDDDGLWCWFKNKPERDNKMFGPETKFGEDEGFVFTNKGKLPAGHDWRQTLEQRPAEEWPEERMDVIGTNGNDGASYSEQTGRSKYHREIKPGVFVDVYDVLKAWDVRNAALQHLIKKALQPGERGHKDMMQDLDDIIVSAQRAKELEQ